MDAASRRLELLKLEGLGFSQMEIVKELSVKCTCSKRTIYSDFETRAGWQSSLQSGLKPNEVLLKVINRYEQIYRQASMRFLSSSNELARMAALNIMLKTNSLLFETAVLPELMGRLRALEDKAAKGGFRALKPWQINNKVSNLSRALDDSAKSETRIDINCLTEPERKLFAKVQEIIEKYAPTRSYTSSSKKHCFREKQTISLKLPRRKKKFAVLWKQVSNTSPSFKALRYSENASFSTQHRKYLHSGTPYSFIYKGAGGGI